MRAVNFARSGWANIVFQAAFLALLYLVGKDAAPPLEGAGRALLLLGLVLVPSVVWPSFFYLRDRNEPEPSGHVLAALLAGMAAASVVVLPVEKGLFGLTEWLYESTGSLLVGSVLIRGTLVSFLFFLVIRYGFLPLEEFDEPEDGMVYGAFVGAGFAAVRSMSYLAGQEGFTLFAIAHVASTNILLYASVGSLVGGLAGRAKFRPGSPRPAFAAALALGILLVGGYHVLHELVFVTGSESAFAVSAGLSLGFAVVLMASAALLMRRLDQGPAPVPVHRRLRPDIAIAFAVALLLALGGVARRSFTRDRQVSSDVYGLSFRYPVLELRSGLAGLGALEPRTTASTIFTGEARGGGTFRISVKGESSVADLATLDPGRYIGRELLWLSTTDVAVGEKPGLRARYAYLDWAPARAGGFPDVVWGYADIVPNARHTIVFTYEAPPESFRAHESVYARVLGTVEWATN